MFPYRYAHYINGHDSGTDWLEVPTIYKAYFSGLCKGISPQNMAKHMVQYLHFRILEFPLSWAMTMAYYGYGGSMFFLMNIPMGYIH